MSEVLYENRKGIIFSNETEGAVDRSECTSNGTGRTCTCNPRCAVCGFGKHTALHLPLYGCQPGSKPWAHKYIPQSEPPLAPYQP